jgi:predicted kinase
MGLFTRLVMLPLAPVEGVAWVARQLEEQAWEQMYGPDSIRRQLAELETELEAGAISEAEFEAVEEQLLDRLDEVLAARRPEGDEGSP